jgi:hypothetical protein
MAIIEISYCCFRHIQSKPWDRLISCIFERHQICQSGKKRKVSTQSIHNNILNMKQINKPKQRSIYPKLNVSTIEDDYTLIHNNNDVVPESTKEFNHK